MASTITLSKSKLVYEGNYSVNTSYSAGDIVNFVSDAGSNTTKLFVYKNSTAKTGSNPVLRTITGTIASLAARTNSVTITLSNNPGGNHDYYVVPTLSYLYSKYFPGDTVITAKTYVSATQVTLTLSKYSNNTSTITNDIATIGPRRIGNRYDRAFNTVDWDVYSESSTWRGPFSNTSNYDVGDIVTKNDHAYICVAPVGYGTGNVGPSSIAPVPDPEYDYLGVWDNYSGGEKQKHQRVIGFPNRNPFHWKGHPFIAPPTTGGTTSSGVSSTYQGGIPWTWQSRFKDNENAWRWNGNLGHKNETVGINLNVIDGEGRPLTLGTYGGEHAIGPGGSANSYGILSEGDNFSNNSFFTNDSPAFGGQIWNQNVNLRPKNKPHIIQMLRAADSRMYLLSNGTVAVAGRTLSLATFANATDTSTNAAVEIPRSTFQDRSIVKIATSGNSGTNDGYQWSMALDECGELWVWGNNGVGQLGLANEIITTKETNEGVLALGIGHEYGTTGQDTKHYSPYKLPSHAAFGGARIVDMCCGNYAAYALDENGYLWSWGYNNYGQLGYSTNSGFNSTDRSRAPRRITSALGYTWNGSGLTNVTSTPTNITGGGNGQNFTKSAGTNASWDSQVYSTTAFSGSVAVSSRTNSTATQVMFGLNSDPALDASYTSLDFAWFLNAGTATIYESNSAITPNPAGFTYTVNSVFSIVYDANEGYVNYYFDLDGDGRYVQLIRRRRKAGSGAGGSNTEATALYFDSSFYNTNSNLTNIQITSTITQRTWNTYGGIQKFSAARPNTGTASDWFTVLDGQGYIWNCGANGYSQLGDGTATNGNNTSALRRRKFGSSAIPGNINNFWAVGSNTFFSVVASSISPHISSNHNLIYGVGSNENYQLTTNNTTDQSTPILINGCTLRSDYSLDATGSVSTYNRYMVDVCSFTMGGQNLATSSASNCIIALDIYGYCTAGGYDYNGASAALADGTDGQNITQNISKMQHLNSNATSSWVRCYMPNTQHGDIIDVHLVGTSQGANYSLSSFLSTSGDVLSAGTNNPATYTQNIWPNQGVAIRVPQYHHGLQ
jgi:hypothetical protein